MLKKIILGILLIPYAVFSQIGINTATPTEGLDVNSITRVRVLPLSGATNAIRTQSDGSASSSQNQTFTPTKTVVADANGVLGYVSGLPTVGGSGGTIAVGESVTRIYSVPTAIANLSTFNLGTYVTANSLPALPLIDNLEMNIQTSDWSRYDPRIYNRSTSAQLISYQSFATQVNQNESSINNNLQPGNYLQVDADNLVLWTTTDAEVEITNLQVQIDANTYRWYEFKWWCMEVSGAKKIFLSVLRKA